MTFDSVFVIDLATRRVRVLGMTPHTDKAFMRQIVRTLTMANANQWLDLRSECEVERGGERTTRRGWDSRGANAVSGPGRESKAARTTEFGLSTSFWTLRVAMPSPRRDD